MVACLAVSFTSCDDFLTYQPSDSVDTETAISTAQDIEIALNGTYYTLGKSEFFGRNVLALGDIASDNCFMVGSSGHFGEIYKYTVTTETSDLKEMWSYGYKVIDRATRIIKAGEGLMATGDLVESDAPIVKYSLAHAYALKALAHFALVNTFGLPYSEANKAGLGIVIVDKEPFIAFQEVKRSTVEATYVQILKDIEAAKENIALFPANNYRFNEAAIYALEARVNLYMGNWSKAKDAAVTAIAKRGGALEMNSEKYESMWASIALSSEDIFTISKTVDDNLSANSLNTLYGSYDGKATQGLFALFTANDMRKQLFEGEGEQLSAKKFMGLPDSKATSNIPVFRLPEMYLIIAEAKAQLGDATAVDAVFEIAKRNPDLKKSDIPTGKAGLLEFISVERRRELFQEGHRWYDLRRTGEIMTRVGGNFKINNWDASKFVYPIPSAEINASGLAQNENWFDALPK